MKTLGKYLVLTEAELRDKLYDERQATRKDVVADTKEQFKDRIESLENTVKLRDKKVKKLEQEVDDVTEDYEEVVERLNHKITVLEETRDDVRDMVKLEMKNADLKATLEAKKEGLDAREASMKDRESKLASKEETNYKKGYADGVSDGVRKISDITQEDRNQAMKIAMVSAASHTSPTVMQELNNVHQITGGATDDKTKKSA